MGEVKEHNGGCHCGAVRFIAEVDASSGSRCNCSICTKLSHVTAIVKPDKLRLTQGEDALLSYAWGSKVGTRYFCRHCGITVFGRGSLAELGGEYASVSLNTLDDVDPIDIKVVHWDGRHNNWEAGPRDTPWPIADGPAVRVA